LEVAKRARRAVDQDVQSLQAVLRDLEEYRAAEVLGAFSFELLCAQELSLSPDQLIAIKNASATQSVGAVLKGHGGDRRSNQAKADQVGRAHLKGRGSIARTLAQLEDRGHSALAARVRAGQLSAQQAAIKAGIRYPRLEVRGDDVLKAVRKLIKRYGFAAVLKACEECRE
jgi:hypothetical protein